MNRRLNIACLGLACLTAVVAARADEDGLLGHWSFDERQGDVAVDSSGLHNDGDIWGAEWAAGSFGTALRFDGQSSFVSIPEIAGLDGAPALTVSAWVYWESTGRYPNIVTGGVWSPGGFLLFVSDQQCSFRMGRPGFSAARQRDQWRETSAPLLASIQNQRWYHIAATFERPRITTYVNGRPVGAAQWDYPVGYQGNLVIGKWAGQDCHDGLIDDVRIYNRALTPEQVAEQYRAGVAGRATPPAGEAPYRIIPRSSQLAVATARLENEVATLALGPRGRCLALLDKRTGQDRLLRTTPFASLRIGDRTFGRSSCTLADDKLVFHFDEANATLVLGVVVRPRYFVFRVESIDNPDVDCVTFASLHLQACQYINDMSGLATDDETAVCLRALNLQTSVDVHGNPPTLSAAATRARGVPGAAVALVAAPARDVRSVLQDLVRQEGLLVSPLGGPFARDADENRASYLFANVSEANVDQWIELAQRGGLRYIHLIGWEESLGHYAPQTSSFPHGIAGLKQVVDRIHAAGLKAGMHTLTGCIDTHDAWVRPVPDARLATDGTFTLATAIGEQETGVPTLEPPGDFPTIWAYGSRGNCIRIENELILYTRISDTSACGFFDCQRGAFGTQAARHAAGAKVRHMYVRYGCFQPDEDSTLVNEVAEAIAGVYNRCGFDQIYMDGAEAMRGWFGVARMRQAIFSRLVRPALVEASCWDHHSWPFHSRIGAWDHPKWGLKRFADEHLEAVDAYRRGSLLEAQLGWWVILEPARDWDMEMPDEMEYLCAKALGHDVPLSFQGLATGPSPPNARQNEYLTTIGNYERLRLANYFTDSVQRKLTVPREEFRLVQSDDGSWQLVPTDYSQHKVTELDSGSHTWKSANRFASQNIRLRIEALYSVDDYDDSRNTVIADLADESGLAIDATAPQVTAAVERAAEGRTADEPGIRLTAENHGDSAEGAWARIHQAFDPVRDLTPFDALGLWVHGDGKGELINVQLTNLPEYFTTYDDHYIKVDFVGWRYCALLLRERDAAAYHDYRWPYGAHTVLHRSPLVRQAVDGVTLYLNNVPAHDTVTCKIGPIKALRTRQVVLRNPAIRIGTEQLVFPVDLESGMYIEFDTGDDCRVYDERGAVVEWLRPQGSIPTLATGDNTVSFRCEPSGDGPARARVTVISCGTPLANRRPDAEIDWPVLAREYTPPRTILALDGHQNHWQVACRSSASHADVGLELEVEDVAGTEAAYESASADTMEDFQVRGPGASIFDPGTAFAIDPAATATGCLDGVTQQLTLVDAPARYGATCGCYTATSSRGDGLGWSYKSRQFSAPVDLSPFAAIGFWLHGDGQGELFKLQLRDAAGGWQDMVTQVNFKGWRYCHFALGGPQLKQLDKVQAMNFYYNGLPAGKEVTCHIDDIRLIRRPPPVRGPVLTFAGREISFPVEMTAGDVLIFRNLADCFIRRSTGSVERVQAIGQPPRLEAGTSEVVFSLSEEPPPALRIRVGLVKSYPR